MARLIDADALLENQPKGCYRTSDWINAAPTVPAIPVEWINWRVRHADKEGFKDAASAFRWVLWCWENQKEEWRKGGVQP